MLQHDRNPALIACVAREKRESAAYIHMVAVACPPTADPRGMCHHQAVCSATIRMVTALYWAGAPAEAEEFPMATERLRQRCLKLYPSMAGGL